jgi:hypothetical protein
MQQEAKGDGRKSHRLQLLARTSEDLIIPPRFAAYPDCEDAIWHGLQRAMTGALAPKEAVHEAAEACARVLERAAVTEAR